MSNEAARLLRDTDPDKEEITCINCGRLCSEDDDLCPHCEQIPKFVLLKDLGMSLPIGLLEVVEDENGKREVLQKPFDVIAGDWNVEKAISDTWKKVQRQPGVSAFDYLVCVLVHTVKSLAGSDFQRLKHDRRVAILNNMFGGDIFYMYTWARIVALGETFTIKDVECKRCPNIFNFPVDLMSLEVACRNDPKSLYRSVELRDGFETGGEKRFNVKLRPATFVALAHSPNTNEAEMFRSLVRDCVIEIDGLPEGATMTDSDIQQLSKFDMALLSDEVDLIAGGPQWYVEGECPKCNAEFDHLIDWRYSNFFRQSSRSSLVPKRSRR